MGKSYIGKADYPAGPAPGMRALVREEIEVPSVLLKSYSIPCGRELCDRLGIDYAAKCGANPLLRPRPDAPYHA